MISKINNTLIKNANIYTLNDGCSYAKGILITDNKITKIFNEEKFDYPKDAKIIDLDGKTIIPAITDSHIHLEMLGHLLTESDLSDAKSEDECIEILKKNKKDIKKGEWIFGRRWGHNLWTNQKLPTRFSLDKHFPDNPVVLLSRCHHLVWMNSSALKLLEINENTIPPHIGEIEKDKNGIITGVLKEAMMDIAMQQADKYRGQDSKKVVLNAISELHKYGICAIHVPEDINLFSVLQEIKNEGLLKIRVNYFFPYSSLEDVVKSRIKTSFGDEWLRVGGVKLFMDGSLGGRTALMYEAYEGEPGNVGIPFLSKEELRENLQRLNENQIAAKVHAIGDKAVRDTLEAFENVNSSLGNKTFSYIKNRIEHFQLFRKHDLELIRKIKPIASMQPAHLCADHEPADKYWGKRARYAYAFKSIQDNFGTLIFGSDAPVEPVNPFIGIYGAVTRQDIDGKPSGGWYPEEKLDLMSVLKAYTINPAVAANELYRGSIEIGKVADLIVLDRDILKIEQNEIKDIKVLITMINGEIVYSYI